MKRVAAVCALSALVVACETRSPIAPSGNTSVPPATSYTVSGTVTDQQGEPVVGALVEVHGRAFCTEPNPGYPYPYPGDAFESPCPSEYLLGTAETDSAGAFTVGNLPAGTHRVVVHKDGASVSTVVSIEADATVAIALQ